MLAWRSWVGGSERIRRSVAPIAIVFTLGYSALEYNKHYPIGSWLFWRYAVYWLGALVFGAASVSTGLVVVRALLGRRRMPLPQRLTFAFATGVYLFALGLTGLGLVHAYGTFTFFALPVAMMVPGASWLWRHGRRALGLLRRVRARRKPAALWMGLAPMFGLAALALIYFSILTPENAAYDARWQHLAIAEQYASRGSIEKFMEGWFVGAAPHLTSVIYSWAFLLPKSLLFDRIELAAHVEFVCFLATLVGVAALASAIAAPKQRSQFMIKRAWVVRFIFPGVFLYDSSLCLGADHVAAIFAAPIFLGLLRCWRSLDLRNSLLLALVTAGAIATKYTGAIVLVGPAAAIILVRVVSSTVRSRSGRPLLGGVATAGAVVVFTAPHWVKNWIWYGDPLYPVLWQRFSPRPWTPDAGERFERLKAGFWRPTADWKGVVESLRATVEFSFKPHDWPRLHGAVPVFGSLFTLLVFALPFLKGNRRLWALVAAVHVGVFGWYWVHHEDRYLQTLMPWIAAASAVMLGLAMRGGLATRVAAFVLTASQVIWGGDVYFFGTHTMVGSPAQAAMTLLSQGFKQNYAGRFDTMTGPASVAQALPPGSKVLVHATHIYLGLGAPSVQDSALEQGGISYAVLGSAEATRKLLLSFGVTHVFMPSATEHGDSLGGDVVFWGFALGLKLVKSAGGVSLYAMPADELSTSRVDPVLVMTCAQSRVRIAPGLYHLADLTFGDPKRQSAEAHPFRGSTTANTDELASSAAALAIDPQCRTATPRGFAQSGAHAGLTLFYRLNAAPSR